MIRKTYDTYDKKRVNKVNATSIRTILSHIISSN